MGCTPALIDSGEVTAAVSGGMTAAAGKQGPGAEPDAAQAVVDGAAANESAAAETTVTAAAGSDAGHGKSEAAFSKEALYELLVAELALRQGDVATALSGYARQALLTEDPGVVGQAVKLAVLAREVDLASQLAELWVTVAPQDPHARQAAALASIRQDDLHRALLHLAELRAQTGTANFGYLASRAAHLGQEARADLAMALTQLAQRFPDDVRLAYARALLLEQTRRPEQALAVLDQQPLEELPREAVLLQSQLLARLGEHERAIAVLDARLEGGALDGSDESRLRYARARLLIDAERFAAAREDFEALLDRVGENPEILLSLALLALEQEQIPLARQYLERLLATGRRQDVAHYYLGELARNEGDLEAAVAAFRQVMPGAEFRSAQTRASALLLQHTGREGLRNYLTLQRARYPEEAVVLWLLESGLLLEVAADEAALAVLDEAIGVHPDDAELRYARALARKRFDDVAGLESDLQHILALDPDHAMALNALGYTLADRTQRLAEAKSLIVRALDLRPDEPAYLDSLGWVEYRLGNHERALSLLTRAYALMPDHEIAAHLGEVLWVLGQREAAVETWEEGLALDPDSGVLAETMQRLLGRERGLGVGASQ